MRAAEARRAVQCSEADGDEGVLQIKTGGEIRGRAFIGEQSCVMRVGVHLAFIYEPYPSSHMTKEVRRCCFDVDERC